MKKKSSLEADNKKNLAITATQRMDALTAAVIESCLAMTGSIDAKSVHGALRIAHTTANYWIT